MPSRTVAADPGGSIVCIRSPSAVALSINACGAPAAKADPFVVTLADFGRGYAALRSFAAIPFHQG